MPVLFMDTPDSREGATKWNDYDPSIAAGVTPDGGDAYSYASSGSPATGKAITPTASVVVNCRMHNTTLSGDGDATNSDVLWFGTDAGATRHINFGFLTDGSVRIRRGAGTGTILATSAPGVLTASVWFDLEVRVTIADAGGRAQVWVNGALVIDFTGDTRNGGTSTLIDMVVWSRGNSGTQRAADFVIRDDTAPIGPCRVVALRPNGAGAHTDLTPTGAATNWEAVDEQTPDGLTSYNASALEGDIDTYTLGDLPAGTWDVIALQAVWQAAKSDANAKFARPVLRIGGTDYVGASQAVPASFGALRQVFNTSPDTAAAWTEAEVDALEAGIEVRDS